MVNKTEQKLTVSICSARSPRSRSRRLVIQNLGKRGDKNGLPEDSRLQFVRPVRGR